MVKAIPYTFITAFSADAFGGNPAAVAFIDEELPTETLMKIAVNFNQPITAIISAPRPSEDPKIAKFGIRWFAPVMFEVPLCGHGTLAAAKAVFERAGLVSDEVEVVEFETLTHGTVRAKRIEGGWLEIELPSGTVQDASEEEKAKLTGMMNKAFGRELQFRYVGVGGPGFEHCMMIELDAEENLKESKVKANELVSRITYATPPSLSSHAIDSWRRVILSTSSQPIPQPEARSSYPVCSARSLFLRRGRIRFAVQRIL